jgi:Cu+-exporting ATPase
LFRLLTAFGTSIAAIEIKNHNKGVIDMQIEPAKSETAALNKLDLPISGMSCASCVTRIEKGLSKVPGVVGAKVNFAVEKATPFRFGAHLKGVGL